MEKIKILGFALGMSLIVGIVALLITMIIVVMQPESASFMSVVGGSTYDVDGSGRVDFMDVKYCIIAELDERCDFNKDGAIFDREDRQKLARAIVGIQTLNIFASCNPKELNNLDANSDCVIDDFELLDAIDRWSAGEMDSNYISDFCLLAAIDDWAGGAIPDCIPDHTYTCVDSDAGKVYDEYGTVTSNSENYPYSESYPDVCSKDDPTSSAYGTESPYLKEYYCENNALQWIPFSCTHGCENGACKPEPAATTTVPGATTTISQPNEPLLEGITTALNNLMGGIQSMVDDALDWLKQNLALSYMPLSYTSAGRHPVGDTITVSASLTSSVQIDNDYSDGQVTYLYSRWIIYKDSSNNIYDQTSWEQMSSTTFSPSVTKTYNQDGEYVFVAVIASATSQYDYNTGTWGSWSTTEVAKETVVFTVGTPSAPAEPSDLGGLFSNIMSGIANTISSVIEAFLGLFG